MVSGPGDGDNKMLLTDVSMVFYTGDEDEFRHIGRKRQVEHSLGDAAPPSTPSAAPTSLPCADWDMHPLLEGLVQLLTQRGHLSHRLSKSTLELLLRRTMHKWLSFVSLSLHIITRLRPRLFQLSPENALPTIPEDIQAVEEACIAPYASVMGLRDIASSSAAYMTLMGRAGLWLDALEAADMLSQAKNYVMSAVCWNPVLTIPSFVSIPDEYTKLHGYLNSQCSFEYPALCLCCGAIIDSGMVCALPLCLCVRAYGMGWRCVIMVLLCSAGRGMCTAHVSRCGGEVGIFFLLQVAYTCTAVIPIDIIDPFAYTVAAILL